MPECDHCGEHVSERFERVFADEYGEVNDFTVTVE